ncbi:chemoreceptor McpA [Geobacter sp. OR-1]|uniref:methyl-accepting chemotaxis protein n=1 Tax=Geobacter sp. OR-1 TaxID=1266765 RepID=UPI0005440D18|nr:methyl-accepting chemotaxis protein [Geobacter sp. OR-1]GAM08716.1 chemoreceptor McpA [Geobacter sp. OR-1]
MKKANRPEPAQTHSDSALHDELSRLAAAMMEGRLDERGDPSTHAGADAELIALVNRMLDTLVAPLHLAAGAIDEIAHGRIPPFVIDDYKGEFNNIKLNLNTLLATLYGLNNETRNLIGGIEQGKLRTRGNDWDYEGIWHDLISGVNRTLDGIINPVHEASAVLERLAGYELGARMKGKYRGEHAVIKKAMNATAESLHSAIAQVAESVGTVTDVGNRITQISHIVSEGAAEQKNQLSETSKNLAQISESSIKSAQNTNDARQNSQLAAESIATAKEEMERMLDTMGEIRASSDNTAAIVQEIDAIAKETETLSTSAAEKATRVRSSAGGFGVVANEIRNLSVRCENAVKQLEDFRGGIRFDNGSGDRQEMEKLQNEFQYLIDDLNNIAMLSNLLGVNAAIEAAHVEGAGNDFEGLTEEIRQLAKRSTDASKRTDLFIRNSVELSHRGESLAKEIDDLLVGAVQGAHTIGTLTDEISMASQEQASGLDMISRAVSQINDVTHKNAEGAFESAEAARNLESEVNKLARMVSKFRLSDVTIAANA